MFRTLFFILVFTFCIAGLNASAQEFSKYATTPTTEYLGGQLVSYNKYTKIKGSPYLYDVWLHGEVVTNDGKTYKKMLIKFNTEKDELIFVYEPTDVPEKFADPIRMFTIHAETDRVFVNQFPKVDKQNAMSYYEVLVAGNTMLLKRHKEILESSRNEWTRASTDGVYSNRDAYYLYKDSQMLPLNLNKNSILKLLADKSSDVNAYADSQKVNFEQEGDLIKLLNYYNTLK